MLLKRIIFREGAGFLHAVCQDKRDADKWSRRWGRNSNFKSVEVNSTEDVSIGASTVYHKPYKYIVSAEKHGIWFSDEFPFRAGLDMLFRSTVMSSADESKLIALGVMRR